jgi:hypothetical protein
MADETDLTTVDLAGAKARGRRRPFRRYASFVARSDASEPAPPAVDGGDEEAVVPAKASRIVYGRPVI